MATSCNLKEEERCCRTEITTPRCTNVLQNISGWDELTERGTGCVDGRSCHRCPCYENYCCSLGDLCNGCKEFSSYSTLLFPNSYLSYFILTPFCLLFHSHIGNGDLVQTGTYPQKWYCEKFHEESSDLVLAPALLLLLLVIPGILIIRRIGTSRGGDCYQQIKPSSIAPAPPDDSSSEEEEKEEPPGRPKLRFQPIAGR